MAALKTVRKKAPEKALAVLGTNRGVVLAEADASKLWNKGCFGELKGGKLELSLVETLFLMETGKVKAKDASGKAVRYEGLFRDCCRKYESFVPLYGVYKDLRGRGYVVKTGFKFGTHFRLYERGTRPGGAHAPFLVHVLPEEHPFSLQDLSRSVRLSHSVRKKVWYAVVDSEGDVTYYEIIRLKP